MLKHDLDQGSELTVIGRGTTIRGEVDFDQGARILGVFEGKIRSQGEVQIGETAECRAEVDAARIRVEGHLEGNVTARDRLHLSQTANMVGDICAARLHVDEGATFIGHCRVGADAIESTARPTPVAPRAATPTETPRHDGKPLLVEIPSTVDFKPPWRDAARASAATTLADQGARNAV